MRHCQSDGLTVFLCPPIGCFVRLNCRLYPSIAINFIYQSVCAYLNLWLNELMIPSFGLVYSCLLSVHFPPICLRMSFNPFPPPPPSSSTDIHLALFAWVSIMTRNHLRSLVLPHFITCLTDLFVIKHSASDLYKRHSEKNALQPAEDLLR